MSFLQRNPGAGGQLVTINPAMQTMTAYMPPPAPETMTIDFRGLILALLRRKWLIAAPFVLFSAIGVLAAMQITTLFTAVVQVLVDPRELQVVRPDTNLRSHVPEAFTNTTENALVMIRSNATLARVVDRENLADDLEFTGKPGLFGAALDNSPEARRTRAITSLERRVGARRADRSSVVEATVWSQDRVKAARIANAVAAVFLEVQNNAEADTARKASQSVTSRLDELGSRVQKAERDVEEYKARNNLQTANGKLVGEQQLQELNSQLVLARARTSEARSKYDSVRKLSMQAIERGELPDAANGVLSQLRLKYAEAARIEADARTKFGAKHPEMVSASAQVRDMRALVTEELGRISKSAQAEFERARAAEDSLSRSLDQLKLQSSDTSEASVRLRELERLAEATRTIYASFLKRARELSEQEDLSTYNARVVSAANIPQFPSNLSRSMVVMGASLAGLMLGLLIALLTEQFDSTLRNRKQFQTASGLPVLAELPAQGRSRGVSSQVLDQPRSPFALGACRVADTFAAQAYADRARSVLFLTVGPKAQATDIALNAAIAAAQATWRVLMIDADMTGSGLSGHLETQPRFGLAEVVDRRGGLASAVLNDERSGLKILALTGAYTEEMRRPTPQQIRAQVLSPANAYELVFIDGGPLERSAGALAFAAAVDDIVLVAASGSATVKDLREAVDALSACRDKLRGVITV